MPSDDQPNMYNTPAIRPDIEEDVVQLPPQKAKWLTFSKIGASFLTLGVMLTVAVLIIMEHDRQRQEKYGEPKLKVKASDGEKDVTIYLPQLPDGVTVKADQESMLISTNQGLSLIGINIDYLFGNLESGFLPDPGTTPLVKKDNVPGEGNQSIPLLLTQLARTMIEEGKHAEAEDHLLRAIELNPGALLPKQMLGVIYESLGQFEKARGLYRELVELDPAKEEYLNNLAMVEMRLRNFDGARKHLESALRLNENFLDARTNLALLSLARGEHHRVVELLETWLTQFSDHYVTQRAYFLSHMELGEVERARKGFITLSRRFPEQNELFYLVARTYARVDDHSKAIGWLRTCEEKTVKTPEVFKQYLADPEFDRMRGTDLFRRYYGDMSSK